MKKFIGDEYMYYYWGNICLKCLILFWRLIVVLMRKRKNNMNLYMIILVVLLIKEKVIEWKKLIIVKLRDWVYIIIGDKLDCWRVWSCVFFMFLSNWVIVFKWILLC